LLALWAWPLGHSIDTRFGLLRGPYIASASRDKVVYVISGGWHTEVGLPVAEISGPNRVLEVPTDDRFGYGQPSFAGSCTNGKVAPKPDLRMPAGERVKATHFRPL